MKPTLFWYLFFFLFLQTKHQENIRQPPTAEELKATRSKSFTSTNGPNKSPVWKRLLWYSYIFLYYLLVQSPQSFPFTFVFSNPCMKHTTISQSLPPCTGHRRGEYFPLKVRSVCHPRAAARKKHSHTFALTPESSKEKMIEKENTIKLDSLQTFLFWFRKGE